MNKISCINVLDLAPSKNNPRNSEGAFLTLSNGQIIFVFSRFTGNSDADDASADICILFSTDNGKSFGNEKVLFTCEDENALNIMSISLMQMLNGDVGIFYLVRENNIKMNMYLRRSSDNCKTWSTRTLCTTHEGFYVVNNDRVVRLFDNSLIIPAAFHRKGKSSDGTSDVFFDSRSEAIFFISEDDGITWHETPGKCVLPHISNSTSGLQEPGVVELSPNALWGFARTDLGRQYEFFSHDGGRHWGTAQPSRFTSPLSSLSMKKSSSGSLYAIWNPIPLYNGRPHTYNGVWTGGRSPLVIAQGTPDGYTFSEPYMIEDDEVAGYCYCAMHFTTDNLLLAYCAGNSGDSSCLARTRICRIPIDSLNLL